MFWRKFREQRSTTETANIQRTIDALFGKPASGVICVYDYHIHVSNIHHYKLA